MILLLVNDPRNIFFPQSQTTMQSVASARLFGTHVYNHCLGTGFRRKGNIIKQYTDKTFEKCLQSTEEILELRVRKKVQQRVVKRTRVAAYGASS